MFAFAQGVLDLNSVADIDKGNDNTINLVIDGTIRTHPHIVPMPSPAFHLATYRREIVQDYFRVLGEIGIVELVRKIADGASFVTRREAEQLRDLVGESLYPKLSVEE